MPFISICVGQLQWPMSTQYLNTIPIPEVHLDLHLHKLTNTQTPLQKLIWKRHMHTFGVRHCACSIVMFSVKPRANNNRAILL